MDISPTSPPSLLDLGQQSRGDTHTKDLRYAPLRSEGKSDAGQYTYMTNTVYIAKDVAQEKSLPYRWSPSGRTRSC